MPKQPNRLTVILMSAEREYTCYKFPLAPIPLFFFLFIGFYDFDQNSVNARYQTIPYPWLVFGEKVKVNAVFIRDSTGVSDSILILFGGALSNGIQVIC